MNRRQATKLVGLTTLAFSFDSRSLLQAKGDGQSSVVHKPTSQICTLGSDGSRWRTLSNGIRILETEFSEGLEPLKQPTNTTCGPTAIWSLCRYVENLALVRSGLTINLADYDEVQKFLQASETSSKFNFKDFVSWQTTHLFWQEHVAPKCGVKLKLSKGHSVDDLMIALERTRKPILVPYIMPYRAACILNVIRIPLALVTLLQSERVYSSQLPLGESGEIVMRGYPHCASIVSVTKRSENDTNPTLHLLDPWIGRIVSFSAKDFERRWLAYFPSIGRSQFAKKMLPIFEKLAAPGSYSTLEES